MRQAWRRMRGWLAAALALGMAASAQANDGACAAHFAGGLAPVLVNLRLAQQTEPLCFRAFAVLSSGITRTPLYSAEHLTADRIKDARSIRRLNLFHPEERLPSNQRAELSDYARSGYDRGHMSPSGDMPDEQSQAESFSLANMVPQTPQLNRGLWERIESAVRNLTRREGELYVVTGPLFRGQDIQALKGHVLVPSDTYKAVYMPSREGAGAYVCTNTAAPLCRVVSIAELQQLAGIDAFPSLPAAVKSVAIVLPKPEPYGGHRRDRQRSATPSE